MTIEDILRELEQGQAFGDAAPVIVTLVGTRHSVHSWTVVGDVLRVYTSNNNDFVPHTEIYSVDWWDPNGH